jgi:hypothetical protein
MCLVPGLVPAFGTGALNAQSVVRAVRLSADLTTDDGSAIVRVEVELIPDDTAGLRVELLGFGRGTTDGFLAGGPDGPMVRFEERSGSRQWIVIERAAFESHGLERIAGGAGSLWRLRATYVVRNAQTTKGESVLVHVPVLTVALPPVRDAGDVFHAGIRAPSSWSVAETFPTGLREGDDGEYAVDLAVAPSVVSLRARTDGAWRPGVPLLLDIAAGMILLVFVVAGLRWLRASNGERD